MKKRALLAALPVLALAAPSMAGEFFSGTRSDSSRYEMTRTSVGSETISADRMYSNVVHGSAHKQYANLSASAENARIGEREYSFLEGDAEINGQLQGQAARSLAEDSATASLTDVSTSNTGGLFGFLFGGSSLTSTVTGTASSDSTEGEIAGAAAGELGIEVDGMLGQGAEYYVDGSVDIAGEVGSQRVNYRLTESGSSQYDSDADFTEVMTQDGTKASGGSVFSFN